MGFLSRFMVAAMAAFLLPASATAQGAGSSSPAPAPPTYTPPGYAQPGYAQPGYTQPGAAKAARPSAGGLSAPGPMAPPPPTGARAALEQAEKEDSGRDLSWFYIDVEGGYQYVGLETFDVDTSNLTAGFIKNEASGGYVGAGLGLRLVFLTIGPHARVGFFDSWQMYSLGGRVGFRFPLGRVEPFVGVGGGYTALGSISGVFDGAADAVDIRGFNARIDGGLDFFPADWLSLGGGASWEFLGLSRPGVSLDQLTATPSTDLEEAQQQALAAEGSGYGTSIAISGRIGLHF